MMAKKDEEMISARETLSLTRFGGEGEAPAIIMFSAEGRPEAWSYSRLEEVVGQMAAGLRSGGIEEGERVALFAPTTRPYVAVALAVARAGAVVVPVDAQTGDEGLLHILSDSGVKHIFTDKRGAGRLVKLELGAEERPRLYRLDAEEDDDNSWMQWLEETGLDPEERDAEEAAVLFYTSGTTGQPKGVPLSRRNVVYQFDVTRQTELISKDDRLLLPLPLHHVYPFVIGTLAPLHLGLAIVIPPSLTGPQIAKAVREGEVSVILGVPRLHRALVNGIKEKARARGVVAWTLFRIMLRVSRAADRVGVRLGRKLFGTIHRNLGGRVRLMASGGSPLSPSLAHDLRAFGWDVAIGYGLTETSPLITVLDAREPRFDTVGRVVPGSEVKIDPSANPGAEERGEAKSSNSEPDRGEVMARGPGVFSGYLNLPEKTEEALDDDWFRTGDLGWFDKDGRLHLEGRVGTMLVSEGGENIAPETLEDAYSVAPEIEEVGVLQKDGKLVAVIIPTEDVPEDRARDVVGDAVARIGRKRPSYQRLSDFCLTDRSLPRTRLGKIRRHELKKLYESGGKSGRRGKKATGPIDISEMDSSDQALLEDERARSMWEFLAERFSDKRLEPDSRLETDLGLDSIGWVELAGAAEERIGIPFGEELMEHASKVRDLLEAASEGEGKSRADFRAAIRDPDSVLSEKERRWVRPRSGLRSILALPLYWFLRGLTSVWFRTELRGLENLPEKGPYVIAPNHVSFLDAPVLGLALSYDRMKTLFWAGISTIMMSNFLTRSFSRISQVVPVDPRRGPVSSLALGAAVLQNGHPLVWFPEGGRSLDGELKDFRSGIGLLIEQRKPPVLPVYIQGTYRSLPVGGHFPRPSKVTIHVGKPQQAEELERLGEGDNSQDRIASGLRKAMVKLMVEAEKTTR